MVKTKTVRLESTYTFLKTDLYCPSCGWKAIWHEPYSEVDYGGGDHHVCSECGIQFYAWWNGENKEMADKLA